MLSGVASLASERIPLRAAADPAVYVAKELSLLPVLSLLVTAPCCALATALPPPPRRYRRRRRDLPRSARASRVAVETLRGRLRVVYAAAVVALVFFLGFGGEGLGIAAKGDGGGWEGVCLGGLGGWNRPRSNVTVGRGVGSCRKIIIVIVGGV